jgi:FixJ family two-component response regulator
METKDKIIFIVEDSAIISDLLERVINNSEGLIGRAFATGESMLEEIEKGAPDCLLLDYYLDCNKLGHMNGEQVLQKLQIMNIKVPVVMLTGLKDITKLKRLEYLNVIEVLDKDSHDIFETVIESIKKAI